MLHRARLFGVDLKRCFFTFQLGDHFITLYPGTILLMPFYQCYFVDTISYRRNFYLNCHCSNLFVGKFR